MQHSKGLVSQWSVPDYRLSQHVKRNQASCPFPWMKCSADNNLNTMIEYISIYIYIWPQWIQWKASDEFRTPQKDFCTEDWTSFVPLNIFLSARGKNNSCMQLSGNICLYTCPDTENNSDLFFSIMSLAFSLLLLLSVLLHPPPPPAPPLPTQL